MPLHVAKNLMRDEMVFASIDFTGARSSRGVRNGESDPWVGCNQGGHQAGFSGSRRGRDNENLTVHSMFWTCSRICSMSTFMSMEVRETSLETDFDPRVLASRCSSCIRKSR